jgi:ferredoxin-NADP reductase
MEHRVKIISVKPINHDVLQFKVERPDDYAFQPGQATEVSIDKPGWKEEKRPFTFTNLPQDNWLEFIIKTYPEHHGVTGELLSLKNGDWLILHDVFGTIKYKGKGTFIAGGAGVTPFISILKQQWEQHKIDSNQLIFANKSRKDIFLKQEFEKMLGKSFINILSEENAEGYAHGLISKEFLAKHLPHGEGYVYICGPEPMLEMLENQLTEIGVNKDKIIKEEF